MSKYQSYPEYKDSGVEWLGDVPSHWPLTRVKHVAELTPRKPVVDRGLYCSFIPMEKLKIDFIVLDETRQIDAVYDGYTYFADGDILMAKVTPCFENKNIAIAKDLINKIGFGSSEIYTIRASNQVDKRFLFYRLQEDGFMDLAIGAMTGAGGLKRVPSETVANFIYALPVDEEQQKIANFLDHETGKIDTLIEKQQQLIKLLKEKRQAVISHAVTKGLNPNAPMRDSGVEWLGEVPEHWVRNSLNYLIEHTVDNRGRTPPVVSEGIPMAEVSQVAGNGFYTSDNYSKFITQESYDQFVRSDVKENDILFVTVGATFGKTCLVPSSPDFFIAQNVVGFRCVEDVDPKFFMFLLSSSVFKEAISATNKSSTIDNVKVSDLVKTRLVIPPYEEQISIASRIFAIVDQYERLVSKAESVIGLMQERRTALISAAVTGKIDVRNWVAPEPSNTLDNKNKEVAP